MDESNEDDLAFDDRMSKSTSDVRQVEHASASPSMSRRKRLWKSFRRTTKTFLGRKSDKISKKDNGNYMATSHPNILSPNTSGYIADEEQTSTADESFPERSRRDTHDGLLPVIPLETCIDDVLKQSDMNSSQNDSRKTPERSQGLSSSSPSLRHKPNGPRSTFERTQSEDKKSDRPPKLQFAFAKDSQVTESDSQSIPSVVVEPVSPQEHMSALRHHPFFELDVHLKEGVDLVARDSNGTSDPYVKFKSSGKQLYKSQTLFKTLNPKWDEKFTLPVDDAFKTLNVKVFDYDRGFHDDPMGSAEINLMDFTLEVPKDIKLELSDKGSSEYMGYLLLTCSLIPKTQEEKEEYVKQTLRERERTESQRRDSRRIKSQVWDCIVSVTLVEGRNLLPMDDNGFSDPYVRFKLGNEKYKSKVRQKTLDPKWLEQFDLHLFREKSEKLEIIVYDRDLTGRDDFMGRAIVDLSQYEHEMTHSVDIPLEDGAGTIKLLLTITGTMGADSVSDLSNYTPISKQRDDLVRQYGLFKSFKDFKNVGWVQVKVIKAQGLAAADLGGKSDPFCVVELVNARLQTQTEYKTLNPEWGKVFTFTVKDIHSVLELTVYDEDRDKKSEFLGKVSIPLLLAKINEPIWYGLKDKKLMSRVKGAILVEVDLIYNPVKAVVRTFNPREEKIMQAEPKFKLAVMKQNVSRVSSMISSILQVRNFIQSCFDWEVPAQTILVFVIFLVAVWNFELYMLPVTLILLFLWNFFISQVRQSFYKENPQMQPIVDETGETGVGNEEDEDETQEEKKSLLNRLQAIQEICLTVQEVLDSIACLGERIKNAVNWTIPWLSILAVLVLCVATVILYNIPLRYLILAWGINKFTKKLRKPNFIPNNELLDYLSRVPSDNEIVQYRQYHPSASVLNQYKKK